MKNYFSHDYYSRNDPKLVRLFMKHGLAGIGAYWCVVEMLYEEGGYLSLQEYERITFELRTDENVIRYIIYDSELFENDGEKFWSETAIARLNKRAEKSQKARESIENRWNKHRGNTNEIRTYNDGNTIKEKKSKENEKESSYKKLLLSDINISDFPEINPEHFEVAKSFQELFKKNLIEAGAATINIDKAKGVWIDDIRLLLKDGYTVDDLRSVYTFLQTNSFWKKNILSTSKLREKIDKLKLEIKHGNSRKNNQQPTAEEIGELAGIVYKHFGSH